MAQGNWRTYLQGEVVSRKKYLYVLRPLLALRWIARSRGPVPMEFARLVDATMPETAVADTIRLLVAAKVAGDELDRGPRIDAISDFVDLEMARLEATIGDPPPAAVAGEDLDLLFRRVLAE